MAYATVEELAQALRVPVTVANTPTLQACLDAAAEEIDHAIDWPEAEQGAAYWRFASSVTVADPGPGNASLDNANPANAGTLSIADLDDDGADQSGGLARVAEGDLVRIEEMDTARYEAFQVTGAPTSGAGWYAFPIEEIASSAPPPKFDAAELLRFHFVRPSHPTGDPLANRVNVLRGVEWFKANDAAFGVIGFDQTGALTAPRDGFTRHAYALTPLRRQWGIA